MGCPRARPPGRSQAHAPVWPLHSWKCKPPTLRDHHLLAFQLTSSSLPVAKIPLPALLKVIRTQESLADLLKCGGNSVVLNCGHSAFLQSSQEMQPPPPLVHGPQAEWQSLHPHAYHLLTGLLSTHPPLVSLPITLQDPALQPPRYIHPPPPLPGCSVLTSRSPIWLRREDCRAGEDEETSSVCFLPTSSSRL